MLQALNLHSDICQLFLGKKLEKKENSFLMGDCISDQASDPTSFREMHKILYIIKLQITFQYMSKLIKLRI